MHTTRRFKIKGSSSKRKDPEVRGGLEVQESSLVRSLVSSVTSSIPRAWRESEQSHKHAHVFVLMR